MHERKISNWSDETNEILASSKMGSFQSMGYLTFTWEKIDSKTPQFSQKIKDLKDILVKTYTQMEVEFARGHPELVPSEMFLKSIASLFSEGIEKVDWRCVEGKVRVNFDHFFTQTDFSSFSCLDDINIFVVAKEKEKPVGMIQYLIKPEYDYGHVRVCFYGVHCNQAYLGIDKLLMSSIFKLLPSTKRIFLHTRETNVHAIDKYLSWGFTPFLGPLKHWIDLEYQGTNCDQLQKAAESF